MNITAKPLVWRKPFDHPQDSEGALFVAEGIGGRYSIHRESDGSILLWWAHDGFIWEDCDSVEVAKAKAEADWQTRFADLVALESEPQDCPRAPAPFRYCPDCDGSFPCQMPGRSA